MQKSLVMIGSPIYLAALSIAIFKNVGSRMTLMANPPWLSHRALYWAYYRGTSYRSYPKEATVVSSKVVKRLEDTKLYSCEAISSIKDWLESSTCGEKDGSGTSHQVA